MYVTFVVEKDGSLTDIKVIRDIGYGTGKEAIRVLKKCPKWTPGEQNGKKVRCTLFSSYYYSICRIMLIIQPRDKDFQKKSLKERFLLVIGMDFVLDAYI